jgi:hypothetical protein
MFDACRALPASCCVGTGGMRRSQRETDHAPLSYVGVTNEWSCMSPRDSVAFTGTALLGLRCHIHYSGGAQIPGARSR